LKNIRILQIVFDDEIAAHEIPAFRGAVIQKAGEENVLFHNHLGNSFLYKYPLLQYKRIGKQPCLYCIEYGIDEIAMFFSNKHWEEIRISNRLLNMKVASLNLNQFKIEVCDHPYMYSIRNWIALNQDNIKIYRQLISEEEKKCFLEKILIANILSFAKGIDWQVSGAIQVSIYSEISVSPAVVKQNQLLAFSCRFASNVFLPNNLGLGKSVSIGYGVVRIVRD